MIILGPGELTDEPLAWPVDSSTVLARGAITSYLQDQVRMPDGHLITREYLKHPGAVGVIALDDHDRVALVRQYRHPVRHRLIEPPAGLLDVGGEDYLQAMQREMAEEVGLAAGSWAVLVDLFTTPGILGESLRIYLARDLRRSITLTVLSARAGGTHGHRVGVARRHRGGGPRWPLTEPDHCLGSLAAGLHGSGMVSRACAPPTPPAARKAMATGGS